MGNRTTMVIIGDILDTTQYYGQEGIKPTILMQESNLSYNRLHMFLDKLVGNALINKIEYDGKHTFVITEKGRVYLEKYRQFSNLASSFGLDI